MKRSLIWCLLGLALLVAGQEFQAPFQGLHQYFRIAVIQVCVP